MEPTELNTAKLLVKCLEEEGVEYIFGIPGEENLEVMNALRDSSIKFITTRHEQGAAFMEGLQERLEYVYLLLDLALPILLQALLMHIVMELL